MESHLLQMRGLKRMIVFVSHTGILSHLLQMRGLKPSDGIHTAHKGRRIFYRCVD